MTWITFLGERLKHEDTISIVIGTNTSLNWAIKNLIFESFLQFYALFSCQKGFSKKK